MAENHHSDHKQPPDSRDLGRVGAWLLLTVVIVCFYWKLVLTNQFTWLAGHDLANQVLPWFQFQAGEWHAGRFPLWDPFQWFGQPLAGQAQPGVFYPLNWILFLLPLREGWLKPTHLHWYFVVIHLMGAWFAYLLARDLKLSRRASVLAGAIFSLAGWFGTFDWPQMLNSAVWTPLIFMHLLRAVRGERVWRSAALGGFFLGVAWLAGHHQIPIFVSLAVAGVWIWQVTIDRRRIAAMALFFVMAGATGAAQIVPSLEYGKRAVRWVGAEQDPVAWDQKVPYYVHSRQGFGAISVAGILFPDSYTYITGHNGVVALALMLLGCAFCWRRVETRILAFTGVAALLYSLAALTPFEGILYALVPMVEKARSPAFAIFLFGFAAAILAAFGFDAMLQHREHAWVKRGAQALLALGVGVFAVAAVMRFATPNPAHYVWITTGIAALLMAALLAGHGRAAVVAPTVFAGVLVLFMMEMASTNSVYLPHVEDKEQTNPVRMLSRHSDIAAFLKSQPGFWRFDADQGAVPYNFGDWYGVQQRTGYLASATANVYQMPIFEDLGYQLFGIRFLVSAKPTEFHSTPVFTSGSGLKVYQNTTVLPRAFVVHQAVQPPQGVTPVEHMRKIGAAGLRQTAIVATSPPSLGACDGDGPVTITRYEPSRVEIRADLACKGMLVLSDPWYPGWRAAVDGRDAELHEVDGALRGVVVDQGAHVVEMRYRPTSVLAGAALSVIGFLIAAAGPFALRRFRQARAR